MIQTKGLRMKRVRSMLRAGYSEKQSPGPSRFSGY
ncbi:hypothetical protein SAMN05443668_102543 [Cryptosporangium aurantiacum]|uniref:Uncharacterized protein n=1 Tax=Cryptosporangium aurantiacum TaxID=134849 RepID=A0A1M7NDU1_9ACTN|nr:hypothetical protein SAMN05443668_102543 [Cryptosporangium aurantiacum]